jgi:hypothetical protein
VEEGAVEVGRRGGKLLDEELTGLQAAGRAQEAQRGAVLLKQASFDTVAVGVEACECGGGGLGEDGSWGVEQEQESAEASEFEEWDESRRLHGLQLGGSKDWKQCRKTHAGIFVSHGAGSRYKKA